MDRLKTFSVPEVSKNDAVVTENIITAKEDKINASTVDICFSGHMSVWVLLLSRFKQEDTPWAALGSH